MSYFNHFWQKSRDPRAEHEKAWRRTQTAAWDDKWHALSHAARLAYLNQIKAPTREGAYTQPSTPLDRVPANAVDELVAAGFVMVEPGTGKKSGKVVPLSVAYDFSARIRSIQRYNLLGPSDRENLTRYVKHAFYNQGETVINAVLAKAKLEDHCRLDEGLEIYVTSKHWPDWALESVESKVARTLVVAFRKAPGPVKLADLPGLVKGSKPEEIHEALTDLIVNLVVFEDLDPRTLDLIVGLLPIVRDRLSKSASSSKRARLVVCENPKEIGPPGGLAVNDLRVFMLEVAGEAPRLKQDGSLFQKEIDRFVQAIPPHPGWLDQMLKGSREKRLAAAFQNASVLGFTEEESEDKALWLRLSGKGRNWLASGLEEQYGKLYDHFRESAKRKQRNNYYDGGSDDYYGDSKFFGIAVSVRSTKGTDARYQTYYSETKPEQRDALRDAARKALETLPIGVFHRWDSVLEHLSFGEHNPLTLGSDTSKQVVFLGQRQVPRLPEQLVLAGKLFLEAFLMLRLLPFDAFRPAIDDEGKLCVARLPRFDGYFGRPYDAGKDENSATTRVIVQPDFSVVVIGLDPAPAAELAPFCDRAGGHAGQGVLTFKITRDSVIRAATQGLTGPAIVGRLKKHASVDVPANVLNEVREWAEWVRLVNVRPITVVRCPDRETVARVVSALGKKAERLSDTLVALHAPKLATAERQKLREQGILVTTDEIKIVQQDKAASIPGPTTTDPAPAKKRGRPKKVR